MSELIVELPIKLRAAVTVEATRRGVSESAWLEEAAREKLAAESELAYLVGRAAWADRDAFERMLDQVPAAYPDVGDER